MKTIFITITNGTVARNILRTGVLDELLHSKENKIVLVLSRQPQPYFCAEFSHPQIVLEYVPDKIYTKKRKFFTILFNGLTYTTTEHRMLKFGGGTKRPASKIIYWLKHITFSVISKIKILKSIARWIEQYIFIEKDCDYLFQKYKPDVLFCSSMYSKLDAILIKAAKRFSVLSISMPKSWDTVGRLFLRAPSDVLIVNNHFMKKWIIDEQGISGEKIYVCGMPQFDVYSQKKNYLSKEEFCKKTHLDPTKPTILFASEGKWTRWDTVYIQDFIKNFNFLEKYNLILRPHFSNLEENIYHCFASYKNIYIDDQHLRITNMFLDHWDPSQENMDWFAEILHASDVVVSFLSTVILDAFSAGKPVINLYYELPTSETVIPLSELYNSVHCKSVMEEKAAPLVKSSEEVMQWIQKYLAEPALLSQERKNTIDHICYKVDGKSSQRIGRVILASLDKNFDSLKELL